MIMNNRGVHSSRVFLESVSKVYRNEAQLLCINRRRRPNRPKYIGVNTRYGMRVSNKRKCF